MHTIFEPLDLDPEVHTIFEPLSFDPSWPWDAQGVVPPGTFPDLGKFRHSRDNVFELKTYCHLAPAL